MHEDPETKARYSDSFGYDLKVPATWSELDRQMAFFNDPDNGTWGGLLFRTPGYLAWEWWMRFHAKGIWPFSPEMKPQIASAEGVAALEDMIRATEHLAPEVTELGLFENWERFSQGDIYCNIGWGGTQKYLNSQLSPMRGNLIFGQTPGGTFSNSMVAMPYFNWGWNFVVTNNSKLPEIAYLFSLFASSPTMSTLAVRQADGFFDPFRPEHYEDAGIQDTYTPEFLNVHRASLESAIPDLYLKGQSEYFRILGIWLARALARDVSPMQALERVSQRWQLVTNASGLRLQQQRWQRLRSKYPAQVRAVLKDIS
jgi:multiple sugar transport system substrate-binding protein